MTTTTSHIFNNVDFGLIAHRLKMLGGFAVVHTVACKNNHHTQIAQ